MTYNLIYEYRPQSYFVLKNVEKNDDKEKPSRALPPSPFDRAHTTSYSTLIKTMRLSCTVFEI